jgi:hypothetical protein
MADHGPDDSERLMSVMSHTQDRTVRKTRPRRGAAGLVAGITLGSAVLLAAIAYVAFVLWPRHLSEVPPDAPSVPITVAGVVFNVPPAAIRQQVQRRSGAQDRVDLVFMWPSLEPPDAANQAHPPADEPHPIDRLFVTIAGNDGTLSPTERMKSIYPRYMAGDLSPEAGGLMARHFSDASPYKGEDLVFDPSAPERFVTRCSRSGATPGICLMERRIGAADIVLRFPRGWLTDWHDAAARFDYLIAIMRPPGR